MSRVSKPAKSFSTRKPWMPSGVCAQTIARSATVPLVIQRLVPFRIQSPPSGTARVSMPAGLEPKSGSVRPKQPITSPRAMGGSQRSFCLSLP